MRPKRIAMFQVSSGTVYTKLYLDFGLAVWLASGIQVFEGVRLFQANGHGFASDPIWMQLHSCVVLIQNNNAVGHPTVVTKFHFSKVVEDVALSNLWCSRIWPMTRLALLNTELEWKLWRLLVVGADARFLTSSVLITT